MIPGGSTIKYNTVIRVILAGPNTQRLLKLVGLRLKQRFWGYQHNKTLFNR
jgi:hypothetical protein